MTRARLAQVGLALVCAAIGASLALNRGDEAKLERAQADVARSSYAGALAVLDGVDGQAAGRVDAIRAESYVGQRRLQDAARAFAQAVAHAPNDWVTQRDYARVLLRLGRRVAARHRMQRALALNPLLILPAGFTMVR